MAQTKVWENGKWTVLPPTEQLPPLGARTALSPEEPYEDKWEASKRRKYERTMGGCTVGGYHMVGSDEHCMKCGEHVELD